MVQLTLPVSLLARSGQVSQNCECHTSICNRMLSKSSFSLLCPVKLNYAWACISQFTYRIFRFVLFCTHTRTQDLTQIPGYKIFMHPVKEKDCPNYYSQITEPMDLSQIRMKINENAYATREEFLADIRLIYNNSLQFNGQFATFVTTVAPCNEYFSF